MKKYALTGVGVASSGERSKYLVVESEDCGAERDAEVKVVNSQEFETLVKNGEMQLFTPERGIATPDYTEEELDSMDLPREEAQTGEEFWRNLTTFHAEGLDSLGVLSLSATHFTEKNGARFYYITYCVPASCVERVRVLLARFGTVYEQAENFGAVLLSYTSLMRLIMEQEIRVSLNSSVLSYEKNIYCSQANAGDIPLAVAEMNSAEVLARLQKM